MLEFISIENIKGFKEAKMLELNLEPNKPSILVAPNGFGKSSIACGFKALNNKRIKLDPHQHNNKDLSLQPKITIKINNCEYTANNTTSNIKQNIDIAVINNTVEAKAISQRINGTLISSAKQHIPPITLIETVPNKILVPYTLSNIRTLFGSNGKILQNIAILLENNAFISEFNKKISISEFSKARAYKMPMQSIIDSINTLHGTSISIKEHIKNNFINYLEAITPLKQLTELISNYTTHENYIDTYLAAYQVAEICTHPDFKAFINYALYEQSKNYFNTLLSNMNSSNKDIKAKEKTIKNKKSLVVEINDIERLSNGQRDILSFVTQLERNKRQFKKNICILIIDEIFDYLDDANLIALQYFIQETIDYFKKDNIDFYPILLTHLDPNYFKSFHFNEKNLQIKYLKKYGNNNTDTIKLIDLRNTLRQPKSSDDQKIKDDLNTFFFHYNPENKDLTTELTQKHISKKFHTSANFYNLVYSYVTDRYILHKSDYDPFAIAFALRLKIEKTAYDLLQPEDQEIFLKTPETRNKLDFCFNQGIIIPEIYYLLSIIYNSALHEGADKNYKNALISKLENPIIRHMIHSVFN